MILRIIPQDLVTFFQRGRRDVVEMVVIEGDFATDDTGLAVFPIDSSRAIQAFGTWGDDLALKLVSISSSSGMFSWSDKSSLGSIFPSSEALGVTEQRLGPFIDSAEDGGRPVRHIFKPVWQLFASILAVFI